MLTRMSTRGLSHVDDRRRARRSGVARGQRRKLRCPRSQASKRKEVEHAWAAVAAAARATPEADAGAGAGDGEEDAVDSVEELPPTAGEGGGPGRGGGGESEEDEQEHVVGERAEVVHAASAAASID